MSTGTQHTNDADLAAQTPRASRQAGIAEALLTLLDLKRPHFGAHCRRVAQWCRAIGQMGGFKPDDIPALETAALLHDIGFIVVSGDHPPAAWGLPADAPTHEQVGYSVLNELQGFGHIATAILHHHEHYDGTGRPMGLRGDKIPLIARVIAVADAYDVELHPGAGIPSAGEEAARRVLMNQRGKRLDPDLVSRIFFAEANLDPVRQESDREFEITPTALMPGMVLSRDLRTLNNVLLLPANTALTREQINRLLSSEKLEWLVIKAHVDARSIRTEEMPQEEQKSESAASRANLVGWAVPRGETRAAVLALDDSVAVSNAIRRELGRAGIAVTGCSSVEAALKELGARSFDAVITDLVMAGADGFVFLNEMQLRYPALRAVVLSGYPSAEHIRALRELQNVVRFVTKPWSEQVLLASVEEAITLTRAGMKHE